MKYGLVQVFASARSIPEQGKANENRKQTNQHKGYGPKELVGFSCLMLELWKIIVCGIEHLSSGIGMKRELA